MADEDHLDYLVVSQTFIHTVYIEFLSYVRPCRFVLMRQRDLLPVPPHKDTANYRTFGIIDISAGPPSARKP